MYSTPFFFVGVAYNLGVLAACVFTLNTAGPVITTLNALQRNTGLTLPFLIESRYNN